MKKTIAAFLFLSTTALAQESAEEAATRVVRSRGVERCLRDTRQPVRSATLRLVVSRAGSAKSVQLLGAEWDEEACAKRAMEGAQFPSSLAGALIEHPITRVSSLRDRPQRR